MYLSKSAMVPPVVRSLKNIGEIRGSGRENFLLDQLPTMLVLAVLVGIFVALGRHVKSDRLTLWTTAWVLIFVNSLANLLVPLVGRLGGFSSVIAKVALPLAALFFIASLTSFFENKGVTISLLFLAGVPTVVYFAAFAY